MKTWEDWHLIHQPSEIHYWLNIGLDHLRDEPRFQVWWATIFDFIEPKGKRLDVGCGPRPPFGKDSTAIDPLIGVYKQHTPDEWWERVDSHSVPAEEPQDIGKFDTVMCWNCIDHTIGWKDILANLRYYAKKDARIALATDFHHPSEGHPGFDRAEFFTELERYFRIVEQRENFQDRQLAMVLACV